MTFGKFVLYSLGLAAISAGIVGIVYLVVPRSDDGAQISAGKQPVVR